MKRRILFFIPILAFLILCGILTMRGRPGAWSGRCRVFWQQQNWAGLTSLARNLELLGTPDAEVDYFASLAAHQLQDAQAAGKFAAQWRKRRVLNWSWERNLSARSVPHSLRETIGFYRARAATMVLLLLAPLNIASRRRRGWIVASCLLSCAGIVLLLL